MTDFQMLVQLVARLDRNQMAIQAGLEEVALWIGQQGDSTVAGNIAEVIRALNENAEFIAQGVAQLTVSAGIDSWKNQEEGRPK